MRTISLFIASAAMVLMTQSCANSPKQATDNGQMPRGEAVADITAAADALIAHTDSVDGVTLQSVMIAQHGKVVYERWMNGGAADSAHVMHSVSKSFCATAVGMLVDDGKLKVTDKVISFFPDQLPDEVSDNLKAMTVRDLLTMTCGHDEEPHSQKIDSIDWVKAFLAWPVKHKPGGYYLYNSIGTYMLSAIVQNVTGEKLIDYLDKRLFKPLHIDRPEWEESPQGINCGGWGLSLKTEDMAKMGQLFLQKGIWNGKQIVPADWLKEMSSYQVPSAPSGTRFEELEKAGLNKDNNEWVQGYGYQMWICRHNAFRADGFAGQYIMVFPEKDAVLVLTTMSTLYQPYMDLIWEYLLPVL